MILFRWGSAVALYDKGLVYAVWRLAAAFLIWWTVQRIRNRNNLQAMNHQKLTLVTSYIKLED